MIISAMETQCLSKQIDLYEKRSNMMYGRLFMSNCLHFVKNWTSDYLSGVRDIKRVYGCDFLSNPMFNIRKNNKLSCG